MIKRLCTSLGFYGALEICILLLLLLLFSYTDILIVTVEDSFVNNDLASYYFYSNYTEVHCLQCAVEQIMVR